MAHSAIAADIHQSLDVELYLAAKVTFYFVIAAYYFTHFGGLGVCPVLYFDVDVDAGFVEY